jgi:uncharacterized protein
VAKLAPENTPRAEPVESEWWGLKPQQQTASFTPRGTIRFGLVLLCSLVWLTACSPDVAKEANRGSSSVVAGDGAIPTVAPASRTALAQPSFPDNSSVAENSLETSPPESLVSAAVEPVTSIPILRTSIPVSALASTSNAGVKLAAAARSQVGVTTGYDPAYVGLRFPGGDVDENTGVCSDVVVRALRVLGIDLQERLNLDMKAHFSQYPTKWGLTSPDPNIDHRRVPNLATYFARRGYEQPVTSDPADFQPGDVVWIKLPLDHIGIVSDRRVDGRPMLIHNVGQGTQEEDVLFSWQIVGHYRVVS